VLKATGDPGKGKKGEIPTGSHRKLTGGNREFNRLHREGGGRSWKKKKESTDQLCRANLLNLKVERDLDLSLKEE